MWTREARGTDQKDLQGCSTVRRTLPVGDERTGWNVQGRVAVRRTLPLGGERTVPERWGPSGSVAGTLGGEWQYAVHCHSGVSVPDRAPYTATRCRAYRTGTLGAEWQCDRNARGRVAARLTLPLGGERTGQCSVHCHSMSNVPHRNARGRVAVRPERWNGPACERRGISLWLCPS